MEYEDKEKKRNDKTVFLCIGLLMLGALFSFGMARYYEEAAKPDEDEICIPFSLNDLEGENFELVIYDLENA